MKLLGGLSEALWMACRKPWFPVPTLHKITCIPVTPARGRQRQEDKKEIWCCPRLHRPRPVWSTSSTLSQGRARARVGALDSSITARVAKAGSAGLSSQLLRRLGQENDKFKACLDTLVRSCLKMNLLVFQW